MIGGKLSSEVVHSTNLKKKIYSVHRSSICMHAHETHVIRTSE
jgi:hypothetical protein